MSSPTGDARHLTLDTLERLWKNGAPMSVPVHGEPLCHLQLEPRHGIMSLRTAYQSPEPDVSKLKNVGFEAVASSSGDMAELTVRVEDDVYAAYSLLASVMDALQQQSRPLAVAVAAALSRYRDVFASRGAMTTEKEIGLYGELLLLEFLAEWTGAESAVDAWQGPLSEEHDFTCADMHLEVKTTSSERRRHVIHGLDQLVMLYGRPLSLVSIQLTRTSPGTGRRLPQLVNQIRERVGGHRVELDRRLEAMDWHDRDTNLYPTHWSLRSQPRAYTVTEQFPAVTPALIAPVVPHFELVSDVSYKVDLSDLEHDGLPGPLAGFVERK